MRALIILILTLIPSMFYSTEATASSAVLPDRTGDKACVDASHYSMSELLKLVRDGNVLCRSLGDFAPRCTELGELTDEYHAANTNTEIRAATSLADRHSKNIERINEVNYCKVDSDCVNIGQICPYGCQIPINKIHQKEMCETLSKASDCFYMCLNNAGNVYCEDNKCVSNVTAKK